MGEIYYPLTINGNRLNVTLMALLDTGSIHNAIVSILVAPLSSYISKPMSKVK